jgi:hypothetical protein
MGLTKDKLEELMELEGKKMEEKFMQRKRYQKKLLEKLVKEDYDKKLQIKSEQQKI